MAEGKKVAMWLGIGCGAMVLLAIVGGLVCVGVCGAGIGGVVVATEGAVQESRGFLADLRQGNLDAAYQRTSPEFRASHPQDSFEQAVARIPVLRQQTGASFTNRNINASGRTIATIGGQLTAPSGTFPFEVELYREGDRWLVNSVTLRGQQL